MDKLSLLTPEQFIREKQAIAFLPGMHEFVSVRVNDSDEAEEVYRYWNGKLFRAPEIAIHTLETLSAVFHDRVFSFDGEEPAVYFNEQNMGEAIRLSKEFELRIRRTQLFTAFDVYKTNVQYGVVAEPQETHDRIVNWYRQCLDVNEVSIQNPPPEILKYVREE